MSSGLEGDPNKNEPAFPTHHSQCGEGMATACAEPSFRCDGSQLHFSSPRSGSGRSWWLAEQPSHRIF